MATANQTFELIIRGATVYDGTGSAGVRADVGVRWDRIAAIEADLEGRANREVDARGLAVAPGFIDVHSHAAQRAIQGAQADAFIAKPFDLDAMEVLIDRVLSTRSPQRVDRTPHNHDYGQQRDQ